MKRRLTLALALMATGSPALALDSVPAYTPEQDLRCASVVLVFAGDKLEGDAKAGLGLGFAYFVGRWEAATNGRFEDALTPEYINETGLNLTKYNKECGERLIRFGGRLRDWGKKLQGMPAPKK